MVVAVVADVTGYQMEEPLSWAENETWLALHSEGCRSQDQNQHHSH